MRGRVWLAVMLLAWQRGVAHAQVPPEPAPPEPAAPDAPSAPEAAAPEPEPEPLVHRTFIGLLSFGAACTWWDRDQCLLFLAYDPGLDLPLGRSSALQLRGRVFVGLRNSSQPRATGAPGPVALSGWGLQAGYRRTILTWHDLVLDWTALGGLMHLTGEGFAPGGRGEVNVVSSRTGYGGGAYLEAALLPRHDGVRGALFSIGIHGDVGNPIELVVGAVVVAGLVLLLPHPQD